MLFIPGWLISLLTFPGVIAHEFAHRFFADCVKVPVYKVRYFQTGNPAGYVIHAPVKGLKKSFFISIGPLVVNTILCALLTFSAILPIFVLEAAEYSGVLAVLLWIGFSIGMHAFPSNEDAKNFLEEVKNAKQTGPLVWGAKLFAGILWIANALRIVWFDLIYAVLISFALPWSLGLI